MRKTLRKYLILSIFNIGLLFISFLIYAVLLKAEPSLSLVALAFPWFVFVLIYAVVYGVSSCLYVKNIILSQLLFICFAFFMPFCFGTYDFVGFSDISGRLEYFSIVVLFSLIPALITKIIVTILERKNKRDKS